MMIAQELELAEDISPDVTFPPSDLYSDEPPVETELHLRQIILLFQCLEWLWKDRTDFYAAGNLSIYYSPKQKKTEKLRGPDFFVVLGTERKTRKSWVVWEEDGKYPNVIIEILSPSTANSDRVTKKELYQNTFRTPDYFWFDPYTLEFVGFHLVDNQYQPLAANERGHLWSQQLGLFLGIHEGLLRYFTPEGELVPTPEETASQEAKRAGIEAQRAEIEAQRAEIEAQRAEIEAQRAGIEAQRAERLAAKLRELNIDPDTI
ncbi:Uma2 family endonuclease [Sphaerospermopsis aphanizomenoides BCCUSP55]|uniref:Uma2 family endonuclease n=1 Tax=Sphaerospermopsis aphanizomenoides TaxID=459663 RepID=UPI001908E6A0|nr:Uma2 family endonuclease [Sphaerospermopsis aphanizomenoides]MBK1988207.1 Uma2 family endonuclease [Sphaerospermopsis aphanizomenoides BCCUSP55]